MVSALNFSYNTGLLKIAVIYLIKSKVTAVQCNGSSCPFSQGIARSKFGMTQ